jgi:hypothetical protein
MTRHSCQVESGERRPDVNMTAPIVTGSPAGAIAAMAVVALGFLGIRGASTLAGVRWSWDPPRLNSLLSATLIFVE